MKRVISGIFICFLVVAQVSQYPPSGGSGGNADTATALASNPTDCSTNTYATAIAANGNLTCASITNASTTAVSTNTASTIVLRDGSGNFAAGAVTAALTGNASTASALAANPTDCSAGRFANAIAANGDLTCAQVAASNLSDGVTGTGAVVLASAISGFSAVLPLDTAPGSPHAKDDEFSGNSLDAKWTSPMTSDSSAAISNTFSNGVLFMNNTQSNTRGTGIRQNAPTGDFTISAKVSELVNSGDVRAGIWVARTANNNINMIGMDVNQNLIANAISADGGYSQTAAWGGFSGINTSTSPTSWMPVWLRIRWVSGSSTLFFDYSGNGLGWTNLTSRTSQSQPDRIGIMTWSNSTNEQANHTLAVDWFRVTEP